MRDKSPARRLLGEFGLLVKRHSMSCREATALVSRSVDEKISLRQRVLLRAHLSACRFCLLFCRQVLFLREACARAAGAIEGASSS